MSSFKKQSKRGKSSANDIPGTRISPFNSSALLSTGVASLDDILGGGVQVGTSVAIGEDFERAYALLLLKFWIAQGLATSSQHVAVVGEDADELIEKLMATEGTSTSAIVNSSRESSTPGSTDAATGVDIDMNETESPAQIAQDQTHSSDLDENTRMTIAFRYESLRSFQTTINAANTMDSSQKEPYCSTFDLTKVDSLTPSQRARVSTFNVLRPPSESTSGTTPSMLSRVFTWIEQIVKSRGSDPSNPPLRIAIQSLCSPAWGKWSTLRLSRFLISLRHLLRMSPTPVSLFFTFPPIESFQDSVPSHQLPHLVDSYLVLQSFATSPTLSSTFPNHSGMVHIITLPTLGSLIPAATKLSVLRGLAPGSNASTSGAGGMDNNLAFKVKRRRFYLETLHLDVEGETHGERKVPADTTTSSYLSQRPPPRQVTKTDMDSDLAAPQVNIQTPPVENQSSSSTVRFESFEDEQETNSSSERPRTVKFDSSRPELYEF